MRYDLMLPARAANVMECEVDPTTLRYLGRGSPLLWTRGLGHFNAASAVHPMPREGIAGWAIPFIATFEATLSDLGRTVLVRVSP
jgi:hypothetical protein